MPIAVCRKCKYRQMRPKPELFDNAALQSPAALKAKMEWEQQNQERRQAEQQRYESGGAFNYEPFSYEWCAAFTPFYPELIQKVEAEGAAGRMAEAKALIVSNIDDTAKLLKRASAGESAALEELGMTGRITINPVTGEFAKIYALCARMNPRAQCLMFEEGKTVEVE